MGDSFKFAGVNSITFHQRFNTEADCLEYLSFIEVGTGLLAVKDAKITAFVRAKSHSINDVPSVGTMKAQQQELCLIK